MRNPIPLPPSERACAADVQAQASLLAEVPFLQRVLDALPSMAMLLNPQRQLVFASRRLVEFAGAEGTDDLLGLRLGEILGCANATGSPSGCGTTSNCTVCGPFSVIADAQLGYAETQTCSIVRHGEAGNVPLDIEVSATVIEISGHRFTLVCLAGAEDRVRRDRLQHSIFPQ